MSVAQIADIYHNYVTDKFSKAKKAQNSSKPWSTVAYNIHPMEACMPQPELDAVLSEPPLAEKSAEDQPFFLPQKNVNGGKGSKKKSD